MDYLEQPYQHYSHPHEQLSTGLPTYAEAQAMHNYAMAQQSAPMLTMPAPATKPNETKPRLGKDEVDILEREFKKNPKPTTQMKRVFAEDMGVDLARINNWFQNRRAKRKQEKKQEAYEAGQAQEALGYSEPSSPDFYNNGYYSDNIVPIQHAATFPMMNGPPPAVASYNPQYPNPASASMESLQRTIAAAQAGQNATQQEFNPGFLEQNDSLTNFGGSIIHDSSSSDRAQFPSSDESVSRFDNSQSYSYPSSYASNLYGSSHLISEIQHSPEQTSDHTPIPFNGHSSGPESSMPQLMTTFPSQLLPSQSHDALSNDISNSQSPEDNDTSSIAIGFRYEIQGSEEAAVAPPPPSSIPLRSPPPPMDIAGRRKKVHVKPAALTADTLRGRPSMGPRTVSHAEGFRRQSDSPISSPMRRIVSAGGNRNGISGRIQKPTFESAQRSPINFSGFADAGTFMEYNLQSIRNPPILTAGSSLNNSLAPPTPMSPREREMTLAKKDSTRSTASPTEGSMNFVFNAGTGCFTTMEGDQNLASPPETPQAHLSMHPPSNGWPAVEFQDKQWNYEVTDEALFTPAQDGFPMEIHMPQPSYLSSMSQPVTPAFSQFNSNFVFGHDSPQLKTESPTYTLSTQSNSEYSFPESQSYFVMGKMSSPINKPKTFQFSNTTAADFSEK